MALFGSSKDAEDFQWYYDELNKKKKEKQMILKCTCKHESQDNLHGNQFRVHNQVVVKIGKPMYRCTVCGTQR